MKLTTTFWSKEVHEFNELLYYNNKTNEVIHATSLNDVMNTVQFFESIASFVKTKRVLDTVDNGEGYQFAVLYDGRLTPIKWFDLVIGDVVISHDIAFETTLIQKNGVQIPFGKFPMWHWRKGKRTAKYREFNIKRRAYKYIANQVRNYEHA